MSRLECTEPPSRPRGGPITGKRPHAPERDSTSARATHAEFYARYASALKANGLPAAAPSPPVLPNGATVDEPALYSFVSAQGGYMRMSASLWTQARSLCVVPPPPPGQAVVPPPPCAWESIRLVYQIRLLPYELIAGRATWTDRPASGGGRRRGASSRAATPARPQRPADLYSGPPSGPRALRLFAAPAATGAAYPALPAGLVARVLVCLCAKGVALPELLALRLVSPVWRAAVDAAPPSSLARLPLPALALPAGPAPALYSALNRAALGHAPGAQLASRLSRALPADGPGHPGSA
eukprot:tig00000828_g4624.t1